jgi:hypothetical protein
VVNQNTATPMRITLDAGSGHNLVSREYLEEHMDADVIAHKVVLTPYPPRMRAKNGDVYQVMSQVALVVKTGVPGTARMVKFWILPAIYKSTDAIIGCEYMYANKWTIDFETRMTQIGDGQFHFFRYVPYSRHYENIDMAGRVSGLYADIQNEPEDQGTDDDASTVEL